MGSPNKVASMESKIINYWDVKKSVEECFNFNLIPIRKFNPNFVTKENLLFELETLGVPTDTVIDNDVDTLRGKYRALVSNPDPKIARIIYDDESSKIAIKKILDLLTGEDEYLEKILSMSIPDKKVNIHKALSIFLHILNRIVQLLTYAKEANDQNLIKGIDESIVLAQATFTKLIDLCECFSRSSSPHFEKQSSLSTPDSKMNNPTHDSNTKLHTNTVNRFIAPIPSTSNMEQNVTQYSQTNVTNPDIQVTDFENINNSNTVSMVEQVHATINENLGRTVFGSDFNTNRVNLAANLSSPLFGNLYNKLSNPIEGLMKELPNTDGLNVDSLLKFIEICLKIKERSNLLDQQLFHIIHSSVVGPLADRLNLAMSTNKSFDEFHKDILQHFIPSRLISIIERDHYYRLQRAGEPLSAYIVSIKDANKLLRLEKSEEDVVNNICSGLNPEERNRLVFQSKPTSFNDLTSISVVSQNIQYGDLERNKYNFNTNKNNQKSPMNVELAQRRCYKCNKVGHLAQSCRSNMNNSNFRGTSSNSRNHNQNHQRSNNNFTRDLSKIRCFKCNESGHYANSCENKKA
ncbi:putative uncharacterized protein DDB_G0286901 [Nilaparvata lugens]|uniref:putative uncharacterized protein DDB_G0286901 n=1 Tax=Nilaparvata lugens TaxID=108931 RepID=UPI00193DE250|nr:putative uncharacterized protein DDB_G0286901 [Nilaparvata lugens]